MGARRPVAMAHDCREGTAGRREVNVHMQTRFIVAVMVAMVTAVAGSREATSAVAAQSGSCEALAGLKLTRASVVSAAVVTEGPLTAGRAGGPAPLTVPARCVVKGIARPSSDSEIRFELWLPVP